MGEMFETVEIGEEQDDDDQDVGEADLLAQAQRILLRLVMQDDPAELRRVASRYLADSMSPAAVRAALGPEPEHVS
jgi:hypothetical protein